MLEEAARLALLPELLLATFAACFKREQMRQGHDGPAVLSTVHGTARAGIARRMCGYALRESYSSVG